MKRQYLLFCLFITGIAAAAIIGSCKKENDKVKINGTLYDPNIKTFVSNASVTLSASSVSSGFYNSNYTDIGTTFTDGNGAFTFEFDVIKAAGYRIYIWKDKYFESTIDIPAAEISAGTPYTPSYNLYPVAYIKLHVKNVTPYDSNDFVGYSYKSGYLSCYECCTNSVFNGYGEQYDAATKCKTYGNSMVAISWQVKKFNYNVFYNDSVFCTPFDTTFYEILY